jgi:tRNA (guanine37-N1)-methyltransferase
MRLNILKNRVENVVEAIEGDAETIIRERLTNIADRVLMPLPETAFKYLPTALLALKKEGGWIHYYDFEYGKKPSTALKKVEEKVSADLEQNKVLYDLALGRIVRHTGPHWYQIVLDVHVGNGIA